MRRNSRTLLAFLLAPLVPPLLYLAAAALFGGYLSLQLAVLIGELAYVAALIGGVPLHITLRNLGWVSLHDYMVFGLLLGALAVLVSERAPLEFAVLLQAGFSAICGMMAALVFWLIGRPDRAAAR